MVISRKALKSLLKKAKPKETPKEIREAEQPAPQETYTPPQIILQPTPQQAPRRAERTRYSLPKLQAKSVGSREDILAKVRGVRETFPLITTTWAGKPHMMASATIQFNPYANQLIYNISEPEIDIKQQELVKKTLAMLQERLEIDFSQLKAKKEVYKYIDDKIEEIWSYLGVKLPDEQALKVKYYVFRDTIGLGKIEPLMRDTQIEDLACDGVHTPVFIFHRNPSYGEMATSLWFDSREELDGFVMKLAQKCGRTISVATPLLDATLPDGSRLQATFGTDIARHGSNFSIRKFFKVPLTIVDLMNYGTADPLSLAYLWLAIEEQMSVLIAGATATGKTTFLNSICQFIPSNLKIVSIEDTSELQLMHVNWVPQTTRAGFGPKKYGEVTMFDLLKSALRQRPDYLLVGEVRGREADTMFHAMATGHPSVSTIHADNVEAVIDRLTTRPIELPLALLENLDVLIFLEMAKKAGRFARRVSKIVEIEGYNRDAGKLDTNEIFIWRPVEDDFITRDSHKLAIIAKKLGWSQEQLNEELLRRASVLSWMKEKNIRQFREVWRIINLYYTDPQRLAGMMGGR
jgi:flagellar protein FlaI